MSSANSAESFTQFLLGPFITLQSRGPGPLVINGPLLAFENARDETNHLSMQRVLASAFRANLVREARAPWAGVLRPTDTQTEARTAEWQLLCEWTESFHDASPTHRARVTQLLIALAFHRSVLSLVPMYGPEDLRDGYIAALACNRAQARFMIYQGCWTTYRPDDLELILRHAPAVCLARYQATKLLLLYHAKVTRDVEAVRELRSVLERLLQHGHLFGTAFEYLMQQGGFYRAVSYLPFLQDDRTRTVADMDLCECLAHEAVETARTDRERLVAEENLHPVYESRMREALWLGDFELAHDRMQRVLAVDPYDSKARLEMGELYWMQREFGLAADQFRLAAMYGPPGTAIAHFLTGQCLERLLDYRGACSAYLRAVDLDPLATRATARLLAAARKCNVPPLEAWAERQAQALLAGTLEAQDRSELEEAVTGSAVSC